MTATQYTREIIATTHTVRDTALPLELLEKQARQINKSKRKIVCIISHDHTYPPLGMAVAGRVVKLENGHYGLETISALYGNPVSVELPNGDSGFLQELSEYPHPLTSSNFGDAEYPEIHIDPANFNGFEYASNFLRNCPRNIFPILCPSLVSEHNEPAPTMGVLFFG